MSTMQLYQILLDETWHDHKWLQLNNCEWQAISKRRGNYVHMHNCCVRFWVSCNFLESVFCNSICSHSIQFPSWCYHCSCKNNEWAKCLNSQYNIFKNTLENSSVHVSDHFRKKILNRKLDCSLKIPTLLW